MDDAGQLANIICRNLNVSYRDDHIISGLYHLDCREYYVIVTHLADSPFISLLVTDKILEMACEKDRILHTINALNQNSVCGIHQLHTYSEGIIYVYRQPHWVHSKLTNQEFCRIVDEGIREFEIGMDQIGQYYV